MNEPYADYDSPWKDVLERYFPEFMEFFFPAAAQEINWAVNYEFLDKELQQVVRDAESGRRLVDKLVSVCRQDGTDAWVLVHIEVQGFYETTFTERMYMYHYRLFDRYQRQVASLAVLADDRANWRQHRYGYELFGCKVCLEFPIVKLLDYATRVPELEASPNPFAIVVLAYLKTRETASKPMERFDWKLRLFKLLYQKGYDRKDILELTRFLDWVMVLPEELAARFTQAVIQYEEEAKMKYVASFERMAAQKGMEQGLQQGLQQGIEQGLQQGLQQGLLQGIQQGMLKKSQRDVLEILEARFQMIPMALVEAIHDLTDQSLLDELLKQAVTSPALEEFRRGLQSRLS